jgi:GH24 family phage-related lysozyme (muramidase)
MGAETLSYVSCPVCGTLLNRRYCPFCKIRFAFLLLLLLALASNCSAALVELPEPPELTQAGHELILSFEGFDARPAWPQGASGVTIGWGYDLGYYSRAVIVGDWHELRNDWLERLSAQSGVTGRKAKDRIAQLRDILIERDIGTRVFDNVDVAREFANCKRAFPGFIDLRPNAQAALISLTFNRGTSMIGNNRREMRAIRDLVPRKDYGGMATQLRLMIRVWYGTPIVRGMKNRRLAEAQLMEEA